ncbi:MAPEG family protein [Geminicoccus roseus]|uniref:MAPEG family protein n=1 Tax=Geminicoccus roseus TaxID=404900 RepID=UPI0003F99E3B|nr:MAPEG family protein [Geminicoccus roseus]
MTFELLTLPLLALLCLALPFVYGPARARQVGGKALLGNRENLPPPDGVAGRGLRAHQNLIENLVPYAIVVLAAHAAGVSNTVTAIAAGVFLAARLVHAACYVAGITLARSVAYFAGVAATLVILVQLFF